MKTLHASNLEKNRNKLIVLTFEKLTPDTERNFNNIDMFYNIYQTSTDYQASCR